MRDELACLRRESGGLMPITNKGGSHENLTNASKYSRLDPMARRVIAGAIWEIEHDPKGCGIFIEIGVWQAKVVLPSSRSYFLMYSINEKRVKMLTILPADGSKLL